MLKIRLLHLLFISLFFSTMQAQEKFPRDPRLEIAASVGAYRPIGVSVTADNRLFVSFPKQHKNYQYALTEIIDGKPVPYPNEEWNSQGNAASHFVNVQDLFVDAQDNLWILDSKPSSSGSIFGATENSSGGQFKLLKVNTKTNQVERIYTFDDLDKTKSGLNDVRIDVQKDLAYLSDPGQAAIIVLDLKTGKSRKTLEKTFFTQADPEIVLHYAGRDMRDADGKPFRSHVNGIALTQDFRYFYFKPINKKQLYRIETKYLADTLLTAAELASKVEDMGDVGITHGLLADAHGNIYLTTSTAYSIKYLSPDGQLHTLTQDPRLLWPDSLGIGGNGYLYFSCAQLFKDPQWNKGIDRVELPYYIFKIKLPQ
ncbi:gluconolactonase [Sphingobacterium sp. N143]|uniref:L-dopachrome tautomerase-related protein n=1 Tax=Sphingobacterium sp. N143 TaxID=2746727 RepID=UPI0025750AFD|nr:L-dopachrome tautomerase-related protein [Sphingobacterium sp. N143]MDM1294217.1 gluconolactonase [Sphingobacterium sp. N143]